MRATFAVHRERHELATLVAAALREVRPRLDGHRFANLVPPGTTVDADGKLLGLALRQLLDNAAKYSPAGSDDRGERLGERPCRDRRAQLRVGDIRTRTAPLFERFYRGVQARLVPGTGIGLSIVRQIAQAHGGTVRVDEQPGRRHGIHPVAATRGRRMSAGRILVVDDDPQIRRVMRVALTRQGYEVDDAKSGEEALERLREPRFDLVLLDMNMPGMGGLEACSTSASAPRSRSSC